MRIYKYQSTGNDFLLIDGYRKDFTLTEKEIGKLCDRRYGIGADGLIILRSSESHDFRMEFYNNDGSKDMMCGNGGRAIVAFAEETGIVPAGKAGTYVFDTPVGVRWGRIDAHYDRNRRMVTLYMGEVDRIEEVDGMYRLNTGTDHLIIFRDDVAAVDIRKEGPFYRYDKRFLPKGTNVNFVQETGERSLKIRTYEKGVEDETYSCGTGVIAASIAACHRKSHPSPEDSAQTEACAYEIKAVRDMLRVRFLHDRRHASYKDIEIQGETQLVFRTDIGL